MSSQNNTWKNLEIEYWKILSEQTEWEPYKCQTKAFFLGLSFQKLSLAQRRDFDYYTEMAQKEKCYPNHFCSKSKLNYKPRSVEEWYFLWDTHGFSQCNELTQPDVKLCEGVKQSKEFLNLTIRMWVEDCIDLPVAFDFNEVKSHKLPWVWKSFSGQLKKVSMQQNGFVSTFIQNNLASKQTK